jgi:hypothetical protein
MRSQTRRKVRFHVREEWAGSDAFAQSGSWFEDEIEDARRARDEIAAASDADRRVYLVRSTTTESYREEPVIDDADRVPADALLRVLVAPEGNHTTAAFWVDGIRYDTCSCGSADGGWGPAPRPTRNGATS